MPTALIADDESLLASSLAERLQYGVIAELTLPLNKI